MTLLFTVFFAVLVFFLFSLKGGSGDAYYGREMHSGQDASSEGGYTGVGGAAGDGDGDRSNSLRSGLRSRSFGGG